MQDNLVRKQVRSQHKGWAIVLLILQKAIRWKCKYFLPHLRKCFRIHFQRLIFKANFICINIYSDTKWAQHKKSLQRDENGWKQLSSPHGAEILIIKSPRMKLQQGGTEDFFKFASLEKETLLAAVSIPKAYLYERKVERKHWWKIKRLAASSPSYFILYVMRLVLFHSLVSLQKRKFSLST